MKQIGSALKDNLIPEGTIVTEGGEMTVREDELFKVLAHGILLGCALPILVYNLKIKKVSNLAVYSLFVGFELFNIIDHLRDHGKEESVNE